MRTLLLTTLLLLPLLPAASADTLGLDVPPLHTGDHMLYRSVSDERVIDAEGNDITAFAGRVRWTGEMETLVTIEGRSRATDEYGVERDTVAFLIERARDDRIVAVERCHIEPQMGWTLRWDYLEGGPRHMEEWQYRADDALFGPATRYYNSSPLFETETSPCDGYWETGYADFRDGERIDLVRHFRGTPTTPAPLYARDSLPSTRTTWRGAAAMEYRFEFDSGDSIPGTRYVGTARVLFAQGFPGPVLVEIDQTETGEHATWTQTATRELVGYAAGGAPFPFDIPWREHPLRSPVATYRTMDPRAVPDDALALTYPYAQALAAMRADGSLGLADYLDAHPEAGLVYAEYEERMQAPRVPTVGLPLGAPVAPEATGPGWLACFADNATSFCARGVRPQDLGVAMHAREEMTGWEGRVVRPFESITAEDVATLTRAAGIEPGTIKSLWYVNDGWPEGVNSFMMVSQVSARDLQEGTGTIAELEVTRGAILQAQSVDVRIVDAGPLSAASPPRELAPAPARAAAWDALRISPIAAAAAATITGLAFLAILVKGVLLPLYTRLVRDRLLDNSVRARLYDRIRTEPGVHLAELEEYLGVGKGATKHHVDQLARHKFVFLLEEGGKARCYAAGHIPVEAARRHALLRSGSHQRVYDLLRAEPELSLRAAAERLGMSAPSVHRARAKLVREGLLAPPAQR